MDDSSGFVLKILDPGGVFHLSPAAYTHVPSAALDYSMSWSLSEAQGYCFIVHSLKPIAVPNKLFDVTY